MDRTIQRRMFHRDRTLPQNGEIWVFGSNLMGIHGAGAAEVAAQRFQAKRGVGCGLTGNAYAIPTKRTPYITLDLGVVHAHIAAFVKFAKEQPTLNFWVTRVGCVHAGFKDAEIAPLFRDAPLNCNFADNWRKWLDIGQDWPWPRANGEVKPKVIVEALMKQKGAGSG